LESGSEALIKDIKGHKINAEYNDFTPGSPKRHITRNERQI
jgi:hypothetical protein